MNMPRAWLAVGTALLLGGCALRLPQTERLNKTELKKAEEQLTAFLSQSCVDAVDSDVKLTWRAYAQQETYPAAMQAAAPALLRLALNDPLGRPLLLLGSDGSTFTLADNRKAVGYTGSTELKFIRRFLPAFIPADDLFFWLSGRVRPERLRAAVCAQPFELFNGLVDGAPQVQHEQTLSLGVAVLEADMPDEKGLFERADLRLYAAKHAGRNRVVAQG